LLSQEMSAAMLSNIRDEDIQTASTHIETARLKAIIERMRERAVESPSADAPFHVSFEQAAGVMRILWEDFDSFENKECKLMTQALLTAEVNNSGRVKLADFYSVQSPDKAIIFGESQDYLRTLGALDESNPSVPKVIVPNYIASASNCVKMSSMRSRCCVLECHDLMSRLEEQVGAPTAQPEKVAKAVSLLGTETVKAPRALPEKLVSRLHDIAAQHAGQIPLHSRLFAQFLHHAFPRECPAPPQAGETTAATPKEWTEAGTETQEANVHQTVRDLRQRESELDRDKDSGMCAAIIPWSHEEDIFAFHHEKPEEEDFAFHRAESEEKSSSFIGFKKVLRNLMIVCSAGLAIVNLAELFKSVSWWPSASVMGKVRPCFLKSKV